MLPDLRRTWWPVVALLVTTLGWFELTDWDLWIQDWFYDATNQSWFFPRRGGWARALFYTGPKVMIILGGVTLLTFLLGPHRWRTRWKVTRRQLGIVLLTLAIVPTVIGQLKQYTGVYCPWDIRRYGGPAPYVRVFEKHPDNDRPDYVGRGFPAGHASGGFALFALMTLARTRRQQCAALGVALLMGWMMGLYQMAKGAHYLSHTLVTMELAWLIYVRIAHWLDSPRTRPIRRPATTFHPE